MTQVEDKKTPGPARRWSHTTQADEREAEQLQSILLSAGRGDGIGGGG